MRKLLLPLFFVILWNTISATGDSLHYLTPKDTIFLKVDDFGYRFFEHKMERGQTLYSLAVFYGLKLDVLLAKNPKVDRENYSNETMKIPVPDSAIVKSWEDGYPKAGYVPVRYVVKHGDTFYRIAKNYFNIPLDTLKKWNQLETTVISTGMQLHIGYLSLGGIPESLQDNNKNPFGEKHLILEEKFKSMSTVGKSKFHNGAAYWQREKKGKSEFYALHRYAPIGSVIQIKNPMRSKKVYAEVIGRIPDRAYEDDVIVILSPTVASLLGAKDARFFVEVRYF